jgi:hypothetical protein
MLPGPRLDLLAVGRMQWSGAAADQRRTLQVCATKLLPAAQSDARLRSTRSASNVVVEITRASFPSAEFCIEACANVDSSSQSLRGTNIVSQSSVQSAAK